MTTKTLKTKNTMKKKDLTIQVNQDQENAAHQTIIDLRKDAENVLSTSSNDFNSLGSPEKIQSKYKTGD